MRPRNAESSDRSARSSRARRPVAWVPPTPSSQFGASVQSSPSATPWSDREPPCAPGRPPSPSVDESNDARSERKRTQPRRPDEPHGADGEPARAALSEARDHARRPTCERTTSIADSPSIAASCVAEAWISPASPSSARPSAASSNAVNSRVTSARFSLASALTRSIAPPIPQPFAVSKTAAAARRFAAVLETG